MHVLPLLLFAPKRNLPLNIHVNQQFAQLLKGNIHTQMIHWFVDPQQLTHSSRNLAKPKNKKKHKPNRTTWCPTACKFLFGFRLVNYPNIVREVEGATATGNKHRQDGGREQNKNKNKKKSEKNWTERNQIETESRS